MPSTVIKPPNALRVALRSALAAAFFLGIPAALVLWLVLLQQVNPTAFAEAFIEILNANGMNKIYPLVLCSFGWSYALGQISGFRPWWKLALATALGLLAGWFSPLSNMDGWLADRLPMHLLYAATMCGIVFSATFCVGLAYGLPLRNLKAALTISFTTSFASVLALLLTIFIFDQLGIRVGGGVPFAMSKVTTVSLLMSALAGGAVLGVGFRRFVRYASAEKTRLLVDNP